MKMLTNEPIGEDWYDGHAQTALAHRIAEEIRKPSVFVRPDGKEQEHTVVMALEGPWGSGKSNVIKMVENEIGHSVDSNEAHKAEAVFVNYDLWRHRQDLERKSILESIVVELVDVQKVLPASFKDDLFLLTGERVHGSVEKCPLVGWMSVIVAAGSALASAVFAVLRVCFRESVFPEWLVWAPYYLLPICILCFVGSIVLDKQKNRLPFWRAVGKALMLVQGKQSDSVFVEFKHRDEPTVTEFLEFLEKVASNLKGDCKHLILVFDNLDRLNDEEVKKFWSATHVIFAEQRTKRPNNVHVILPYDRERVRKAFEPHGGSSVGDECIRKTIDKIFIMPSVIMMEWSNFLKSRLEVAFDTMDALQLRDVIRIFDWLSRPSDLTPRAMISFVNDMMSVYEGLRHDNAEEGRVPMPLSIVALYVLGWRRFDKLTQADNTELLIVSGAFIPETAKIARQWYLGDLNHSTQMAAVVYQLPEKQAAEILEYQRVGASLDGNMSLGCVCRHECFHRVFSSVIKHVKQFEFVPRALATIDTPDAQKYWDEYYDVKKDEIILAHGSLPIITEGEALMFANITKWQDYYMRLEEHLRQNPKAKFNENLLVQFAESVEKALKQVGRTLVGSFARPPVEPDEFVKYLKVAQENFWLLNMHCDRSKLDNWFDQNLGNGCEIYVCKYLSREYLAKMPKTVARMKACDKLSDEQAFEMMTGQKLS